MAEVVWKSKVTCPKCGKSYVYEYVPGASFTAIRLGHARYMRCQLCHRFATFDLRDRVRPELTSP